MFCCESYINYARCLSFLVMHAIYELVAEITTTIITLYVSFNRSFLYLAE